MPSRILSSLALLVLAVAAERFCHYGYRSILFVYLRQEGELAPAQTGFIFGALTMAALVGSLLAGGLSFVVAPRLVAVIGTGVTGAALFAIPAAPSSFAVPLLFLANLGTGVVSPCAYGHAAEVLTHEGDDPNVPRSGRRFLTLGAFVTLVHSTASVARAFAPAAFGMLYDRFSFGALFVSASIGTLFSAALFAASLVVDGPRKSASEAARRNTAYRTEAARIEVARPAPTNPVPILLSLALAAPPAIQLVVVQCSYVSPRMYSSFRQDATLRDVTVALATLSSFVLLPVLLSLASKRSPISLARFVGVGLVAYGVGAVLLALDSSATFAFGMAVMGIGGPLAALAVVFAALSVRGRGATLVIAGFGCVEMLGSFAVGAASAFTAPVIAIGAALLLLAGWLVLATSARIRAVFALV